MSTNLEVPSQEVLFPKSPNAAVEYSSPSKAIHAVNRDSYYSRSPLNASSYDLKTSLESRYVTDLDSWRIKAQESDIRREAVERENLRLTEELHFWRSKNYTVDRAQLLDLELKDALTRSHLEVLRRSAPRNELLTVEIDSLRNQLQEKMREIDEWKGLSFNQELRSSIVRPTTSAQLRAYEAQLSVLLLDIQTKISQANQLQRDNASGSLSTYRLASVQKEIKDLRTLLSFKQDETQKLREEVLRQQVENSNLRSSELALKEQEHRLLTQVEVTQNRITQTNQLKEIEQEVADKQNNDLLEKIKADHERVKQALESKKLSYAELIAEKEKNLEDLKSNLEKVQSQIGEKRLQEEALKQETSEWRSRQRSTDKQREAEVARIHQEREKSIEALRRTHQEERAALEGTINNLRGDLSSKEDKLRETNQNLYRSRLEKSNLEVERRALQNQVEAKRILEEETERQRQLQLEVKDRVHERTVGALRSTSQYERAKLEDTEKVLNQILDSKSKEALDAKERANRYLVDSVAAERKEREKSVEAEVWRNTYTRTDREKSLEVEAARNLRRSQIETSQLVHEADLAAQNRSNAAFLTELDLKASEVRTLKDSHAILVHDLANTVSEASRASLEAQVWRSRADLEERERTLALLARDLAVSQEIDILRRSQYADRAFIRSEAAIIAASLDTREREAAILRESYARLYASTLSR